MNPGPSRSVCPRAGRWLPQALSRDTDYSEATSDDTAPDPELRHRLQRGNKRGPLTVGVPAGRSVAAPGPGQDVGPQLRAVDAEDVGLDGVAAVQLLAQASHGLADVEVVGVGELPGHLVRPAQDEEVARELAVGILLVLHVAHLGEETEQKTKMVKASKRFQSLGHMEQKKMALLL